MRAHANNPNNNDAYERHPDIDCFWLRGKHFPFSKYPQRKTCSSCGYRCKNGKQVGKKPSNYCQKCDLFSVWNLYTSICYVVGTNIVFFSSSWQITTFLIAFMLFLKFNFSFYQCPFLFNSIVGKGVHPFLYFPFLDQPPLL